MGSNPGHPSQNVEKKGGCHGIMRGVCKSVCKNQLWIDNEVLRYAQQESEELFHSNWNEIVFLLDRVKVFEDYIRSIDGIVPPAYPDDSE